jgi:uncharacterized protein
MKQVKIINLTNQDTIPIQAAYCQSFVCQLRGLMFRKNLTDGEGLLLVQKNDSRMDASIHMMFMWIDLAVIWINSDLTIVDKVLARRWKLAYVPHKAAKYVLETGVTHLADYNIGDIVRFDATSME